MSKKTEENKLKVSKNKDLLIENRQEIARALEILFASGYISRKRLYLENFIRGMLFTMGGVIGATIAIGIFLWILSLFDNIPLVGPIIQNFVDQVNNATN